MAAPPERTLFESRLSASTSGWVSDRLKRPLRSAAGTDPRAVAVMPAALEAAIAGDAEHQVDPAASGDGGADQGRALAGEMLGDAAHGVSVDRPAGVVPRPRPAPLRV